MLGGESAFAVYKTPLSEECSALAGRSRLTVMPDAAPSEPRDCIAAVSTRLDSSRLCLHLPCARIYKLSGSCRRRSLSFVLLVYFATVSFVSRLLRQRCEELHSAPARGVHRAGRYLYVSATASSPGRPFSGPSRDLSGPPSDSRPLRAAQGRPLAPAASRPLHTGSAGD